MKKIIIGSLCLIIAFSLAACNENKNDDIKEPEYAEQDFTISNNNISFEQLGESETLVAKYGDNVVYDVVYNVVNPEICDVINGVVIAKSNGNTTINITYNNGVKDFNEICIVKVESVFNTTIDLEKDIYNLNSNEELDLNAYVTYPNIFYEDAGINYSSSDETVCTVDNDGKVKAVGQGIAIITASSKVEITTVTEAMGMTIVSTLPATDSITVVVDNEYDENTYPNLVGRYEGYYDYQGFGEAHNGTNWTRANLTWIRAISRLELNSDGSFKQMVLNAQRANYGLDESKLNDNENYKDTTEEEQIAIFTGNCYVYNSYLQEEGQYDYDDKHFGYILGMEEKGINNFAETGVFAVFDGNLVLCYEGEIKTLGEVNNNLWLNQVYEPFTNMVAMSDNMSMLLKKVEG